MINEKTYRVLVVLFEGFTVLDMYGPVQAFASARRPSKKDGKIKKNFEIVTVAETKGLIKSAEGPGTYAEYDFQTAPFADILLIPGGLGTRIVIESQDFLTKIFQKSKQSPITATVCTGAALLAKTGLLDSRPATSNKLAWDWVIKQGPNVKWIRKARWVDDVNILTSSGVSAGIDMALHLISRLFDKNLSKLSAKNMEYHWNEDAFHNLFAEKPVEA